MAISFTCFGKGPSMFEVIIIEMTPDNTDNLLSISIDLRRPDSRHLKEFCQCRRSKMGNPRQGGIGKNHKRRLVNLVCPLVSPRPQFTCKGRIGNFRRHCRFFCIDLTCRGNDFWLRLFLILEILKTRGKRELFHRTINVAHIRIDGIVLHENRRRNGRAQDQPIQSAATAERDIGLTGRECRMNVDDSLVECEALALMNGYGPRGFQRILLEATYLLG